MSIQDQTAPLRRVYVREPDPRTADAWEDYGWHGALDTDRAAAQHAALRRVLEESGASVVVGSADLPTDPDAVYTYDPTLMTDQGAVLLRPGKVGRRAEPEAMGRDLRLAGVPVIGSLTEPATAEGGDMFWLDASTLLVGRGYRTNDAGIGQLTEILDDAGADVVSFDLPHLAGPKTCLHLMSLISPLDRDLAVAYQPLMPVRLMELLQGRGIRLIEVPEEEFATMGPNVLALAPRVALALDGNPETRRRMEAEGIDVRTFEGSEISGKGDGGPTCLTRPLERG
jgi:N-dimethylarginine dimethylaminohydrolase